MWRQWCTRGVWWGPTGLLFVFGMTNHLKTHEKDYSYAVLYKNSGRWCMHNKHHHHVIFVTTIISSISMSSSSSIISAVAHHIFITLIIIIILTIKPLYEIWSISAYLRLVKIPHSVLNSFNMMYTGIYFRCDVLYRIFPNMIRPQVIYCCINMTWPKAIRCMLTSG